MFEPSKRFSLLAVSLFAVGACTASAQIGGTSSSSGTAGPATPASPHAPPPPPPPPGTPTPATTVTPPSTPPPSTPATPATPVGGGGMGTVEPKIPTAPATCSADSDCRAAADTCDQCSCRAISKDGALPKCMGGHSVACTMDPCRGKQAVCRAGKCTVSDGASM